MRNITTTMNSSYCLDDIPICSKSSFEIRTILESLLLNHVGNYLIVTFNTDFLRISSADSNFKSICQNSYMVVPDGIGITFLVWLKYRAKISRITGSDLFNICFDIADKFSLRIALVGSSKETLSRLEIISRQKWSNAIVFTVSPPYKFENNNESNTEVINSLRDFKPDILLVSLGCPRQEKWIFANQKFIGATVGIGVGSVFEFYSGKTKRAPLLIQKFGFEWLWRFAHEPVRLGKRYIFLDLPFFIKSALKTVLRLE